MEKFANSLLLHDTWEIYEIEDIDLFVSINRLKLSSFLLTISSLGSEIPNFQFQDPDT
jgi:hypothetical protein